MFFDVGWSELLMIGLVALVVVGPKELPGLMRTIGSYIRKIKQTASSFQRQFEEAVEESELGKLKESVDDLSRDLNPDRIMSDIDRDPEIYDKFDPDNYETFDPDGWNRKVMEAHPEADRAGGDETLKKVEAKETASTSEDSGSDTGAETDAEAHADAGTAKVQGSQG